MALSACNGNETAFTGTQGAPNLTPCNQAVVGDWLGYLAGSAYPDIERCTVSVAQNLSLTGACWQYTGGGKNIPISSGQLTVQTFPGYQTCYISGKFNFSNGVSATLDASTSPDKNNIVGVHWNSAGGMGTFNAVRLIK